jgi:Response regulator containing CheY-like receiver domain and AraC-type DNA-binding domain
MRWEDLLAAVTLQSHLMETLRRSPCVEWSRLSAEFIKHLRPLPVGRAVQLALLLTAINEIRALLQSRHAAVPAEWDSAVTLQTRAELLNGFQVHVDTIVRAVHFTLAEHPIDVAKRFIEAHYSERLTTSRIASSVQHERTYFATMFRKQTGQTLHRYVMAVRLRHAVLPLLEGEKVEAVMLSVGYRSKRTFYREFRALTGLTPSAFRRSLPEVTAPRAVRL